MKTQFNVSVKLPQEGYGQIPTETAKKIVAAVDDICRKDLAIFNLTHDKL